MAVQPLPRREVFPLTVEQEVLVQQVLYECNRSLLQQTKRRSTGSSYLVCIQREIPENILNEVVYRLSECYTVKPLEQDGPRMIRIT